MQCPLQDKMETSEGGDKHFVERESMMPVSPQNHPNTIPHRLTSQTALHSCRGVVNQWGNGPNHHPSTALESIRAFVRPKLGDDV